MVLLAGTLCWHSQFLFTRQSDPIMNVTLATPPCSFFLAQFPAQHHVWPSLSLRHPANLPPSSLAQLACARCLQCFFDPWSNNLKLSWFLEHLGRALPDTNAKPWGELQIGRILARSCESTKFLTKVSVCHWSTWGREGLTGCKCETLG